MSRRKKAPPRRSPRAGLALLLTGGALLILAGVALGLQPRAPAGAAGALPPLPTLDARQVSAGAPLYAQHCAACHGAQLEGEPNWKQPRTDGSFPAPPHDSSGHTWHHPDALLLTIIANGGDPAQNSRMPGYAGVLSPQEMEAILAYIKSSWGPDESQAQWEVTQSQEQ